MSGAPASDALASLGWTASAIGSELVTGSVSVPAVGSVRGPGPLPGLGSGPGPGPVPGLVDELVEAASAAGTGPVGRLVVLVDGRSGTGKTTLGRALGARLGATVVHLDDVYPGWDGLRAASDAVVDQVLGAPSGYRRWDWAASRPAEWVAVDPVGPIIVEGCGALSRRSAPLASMRVWLEADDAVRHERAIGRDGEVFAREWDRWAAQEAAFIAAEDPASLADVVVRT